MAAERHRLHEETRERRALASGTQKERWAQENRKREGGDEGARPSSAPKDSE
jgi:hypothetical protein